MLKVKQLTKKYDSKTLAVNNVGFEIHPSEVCILLGPNGAGKSTSIKCIAGLLRFKGEISIDGKHNKSMDAKRIFGYAPEMPALYDLLTVHEHVEFIAKAYGLEDYEEYRDQLFKRFDLMDKTDKVGKELSKGMQQKVSIILALITRPKLLLFDEPMIGLDPKAINELKKLIIELKNQGVAILVSTHIIDSIEGLWDRVLIMNKSDIVSNYTRKEIEASNNTLEEIFFQVTVGEDDESN